tara:strand:- start:434 stop:721 length:288 start_codon:yes stop_codon:yes gene_type:complete
MKLCGRVAKFVEEDWKSHPIRFVVELVAWVLSISASVIMALTVPNPPLLVIYLCWVVGCSLYAWAAVSRGSFGMLANYALLTAIDTYGLVVILNG